MCPMVQVRDVPADVQRRLKARAALRGTSLSEYLRRELERLADSPTPEELVAELRRREPVEGADAATAVRALREEIG